MTIRIAFVVAVIGALFLGQANYAHAQNRGGFIIPEVAVKKDPGAPKQKRDNINTTRSNIKHQGSAGPVPKDPLPAATGLPTGKRQHKP